VFLVVRNLNCNYVSFKQSVLSGTEGLVTVSVPSVFDHPFSLRKETKEGLRRSVSFEVDHRASKT